MGKELLKKNHQIENKRRKGKKERKALVLYLHVALDNIKRSESRVSDSAAKNPTSSTSHIKSW
jgi:hypothetical protein